MEFRIQWILIRIFIFEVSVVSSFYPEYTVEDLCKVGNETIVYETSKVGSAGTLRSTEHPPYQYNKNCSIRIVPPADKGVVISFKKVDFREGRFSCRDYIKVFHSDIFTSPTTLCKFKHDFEEHLSFYTKGPMTLIYYVGSHYPPQLTYEEGFTLTYTVVSDDLQDCMDDDVFMCGNGRCIPKTMTCDGRNNCGDRSDEFHELCDSDLKDYNIGSTVMISALLFLVLLLLILLGAVCIKRRLGRRNSSDSIADQYESTTTPYQAIHPTGYLISQNPAGPFASGSNQCMVNKPVAFMNPCYPAGIPQMPPPYSK